MPSYTTADIRNVALVGHSGSGKTSLCEAFLHAAGVTSRLGSIADKPSPLATDEEEKERGCSIDSHILNINHENKVLNLIDTPGSPDFLGPAIASLAAAETAMVVINAAAGIQVNTRRMREQAKNFGLARIIVVNRIDSDSADLPGLLKALQASFGPELTPVNLPTPGRKGVVDCVGSPEGESDFGSVADCHKDVMERVAEASDELMNKYFEAGELSVDEIVANLPKAVAAGKIVPVLYTNARGNVGIKELLTFIANCTPSPLDGKQRMLTVGSDEKPLPTNGTFCGQVFKISIETKSNIKYAFIRGFTGHLKADANLTTPGEKKGVRPGHLLKFQGHEHKETDEGLAGDIFAVAKLDLHIGDTVFDHQMEGKVAMPKFPNPMFSLAVEPKARGDETKIGEAVRRFTDCDPCFKTHHDPQTHELVISGVGDMHLRVILAKMHRQFKLDVNTKPPKIPYRETITSAADGHHRHKKQTGGAGQFGEVFLKVEPLPRDSEPSLE